MSEFRIYETLQYQEDLTKNFGAREQKIASKLRAYVYPQLRQRPYYGKNIKKLRGYTPETWRYRIGNARFFYEIDDKQKIIFMISADLRSRSY
ncbi:MAG: type II toxin-antitoxin system RelE/ParE family toxin [Candidatus Aminicenantaceae bacterium]